MGKVLRTVVLIAATIAIAVYAPQLAPAFLSAAVGTTAAVALTTLALTTALGLVVRQLTPKPSSQAQPMNIRQSVGNSYIIIGKRRSLKALLVFFHPRKFSGDHYRYFIWAIAGHRCQGATKYYLNDEEVSVNPTTGAVTSGKYAGGAWLWFGRGTYDTDETPTGWRSETGGKWTNDHVGYGIAKLYAKFKLTKDVISAGMPTMSVEVEGSDEIRDPRDGTIGYTNLATPASYWWLQLAREDGGFGAADDEIPDDTLLSAWTNVCDEDVAIPGDATEKRYTIDAWIETGAPPSEVRQTLMTCCAGTHCYSDGVFLMRPGYWVPPSASLQERDLAGPISIPLLSDAEEFANEVSGTFVDPEQLYQQQPVPTRSIAAADVRQADYDLPHNTSPWRGQRILEIMLRRAQCEKRVTWPMNIAGIAVTAMQTVQLATSRYSLSNYAFVVDSWSMASDFGVTLSLREENAEIYEDLAVEDYKIPAGVAVPDAPEVIPEAADSADTAETAGSAGAVADDDYTYSAADLAALEARIQALEGI